MSTSCHSNKGNSCHCTKVSPDGGVSQNKAHSPLFPSKGGLLAYQHSWKGFCSCPSSGGHPNHIMRVKPAGARLNFTQSRCILLPHLHLTQAHKEMLFWTISTRFFSELHCPLPCHPPPLLPKICFCNVFLACHLKFFSGSCLLLMWFCGAAELFNVFWLVDI